MLKTVYNKLTETFIRVKETLTLDPGSYPELDNILLESKTVMFYKSDSTKEKLAKIRALPLLGVPGVYVTFQFEDGAYIESEPLTFTGFRYHINVYGNTADGTALDAAQSVSLDFSTSTNCIVFTNCASVATRNLKVTCQDIDNSAGFTFDGVTKFSCDYNYVLVEATPSTSGTVVGTGTASPLATIEAISDGQFAITIDSSAEEVITCDFTGVTTMDEVATVLQTRLQAVLADTLCTYDPTGETPATAGKVTGAGTVALIATIEAIADGQFAITIDSGAEEVTGCDFTGVTDMDEVAAILQTRLQAELADTLCVWNGVDQFVITSPTTGVASTVSDLTAGSGGGTDIHVNIGLDSGTNVDGLAEVMGQFTVTSPTTGSSSTVSDATAGAGGGTDIHATIGLDSGTNTAGVDEVITNDVDGVKCVASNGELNANYFRVVTNAIYASLSTIYSSGNDDYLEPPINGLNAVKTAVIGKNGTQPSGSTENEVGDGVGGAVIR